MRNMTLICALASLIAATAVSADTVIELKNEDNKTQFLTNGKMARINTRGNDEYMLINFKTKTIYAVTPETRQIVNVSNSMPSLSGVKPPSIRLSIKPVGGGPKIAGYNTRKYRLSADGEYCGAIYASKDALRGTAIESMFDTMKTMADNHRKSLGGFAAAIPACQMAKIQLAEKLPEIGAPMRTTDKKGHIDTEITMILKNAGVDPHNYSFPPGYKKVSMGEKIEKALADSQQMDRTQKNRPEMQRMMREMQQSGQIPPEALEQMRRYQDMMQQR